MATLFSPVRFGAFILAGSRVAHGAAAGRLARPRATGVGIRDSDVRLRSDRGVIIRLRNHKGDVKRAELTGEERVLVFEPDAVVGLYEVLARWFLRRKALGLNDGVERSLWALPGEKRTLHWRQSRMNDFLSLILRVRDVKPPVVKHHFTKVL